MAKKTLKNQKLTQSTECAISGEQLSEDIALIDVDRINPKANGGEYTEDNYRLLDPVVHMKRHGNYREREKSLEQLKMLMDGREQMRKHVNGLNNRLLAYKRGTDKIDKHTEEWINESLNDAINELRNIDKRVTKHIQSMPHEIAKVAMNIKAVGPITVAYLMMYIDIEKARYASSLWSYVGYDKASHERYTKNVSGGGNKTLRTVLYTTADSFIKHRNIYRDIYDQEKEKLSNSKKKTKSRNTQGKLIECMWKDTKPSHRHGAAIRKMMKHFLADLWFVWRTLEGLDTAPLYVEDKLGHKGIIRPEERGWIY